MPDPAPMTDAEIAEAEALCEAATPGPWRWGDWSARFGTMEAQHSMLVLELNRSTARAEPYVRQRGDGLALVLRLEEPIECAATARFIAASRTLLPRLLRTLKARDEEIERLGAEVERARTLATELRAKGGPGLFIAMEIENRIAGNTVAEPKEEGK